MIKKTFNVTYTWKENVNMIFQKVFKNNKFLKITKNP